MSIEKDDGSWGADPSGLKSGNLKAWRDKMYDLCPNPKIGDIVVVSYEESGKKVGYRALDENGYDTRWQKVSSKTLENFLKRLKSSIQNEDSIFFDHIDFSDHKVLGSMASLADEGFSDEILADFARQMTK